MKIKATFELTAESKRKLSVLKADLRMKDGIPATEAAIVEALVRGVKTVDAAAVEAAIRALEKAQG